MPNILETKLIDKFEHQESFSRDDLFEFYRSFEPNIKEGTFAWRIHDLKDKNIIRSLKRGLYVVSSKPCYQPRVCDELIKLAKVITKKFADVEHCLWESEWLNEFSQHQASKSIIIIEIEKDFVESLYYTLKDESIRELFLNPDEKTITYYVAESDRPIIIKKLITRSPLENRTEKKITFCVPSLEKILVDVFTETKIFYHLHGSELINIYENALGNYSMNFTKLFSYAKRREKVEEIKRFISKHLPHLPQNLIE